MGDTIHISKKAALKEVADFRLHRETGKHHHIDAEAMAAHFLRAAAAGARVEEIVAATAECIQQSGGKQIFPHPRRVQIERMQAALREAVTSLPSVAQRLGLQKALSDDLPSSLCELATLEFCPKTRVYKGLSGLTQKCRQIMRAITKAHGDHTHDRHL